ncbi:MAG: hypothetical protein CSA75_03195 [Sorangium cellulosum]|nr:MAG: hypothetical protein CSA75_03195 [Sorangium cellulosum]
MRADPQRLIDLCRDVLRPLIEADNGKLFLVSADDNELVLHLGGTCSGCPGAPLTIRTLIEPAVRQIDPHVRVVVTVGAKCPANAVFLESKDKLTSVSDQTAEKTNLPTNP